jgi:hypothetical protein
MSGQVNVTFKIFTPIDFSGAQRLTGPGRTPPSSSQQSVLRAALRAFAAVSSKGPKVQSALALASPPPGTMSVGGTVSGAVIRRPLPDFTVTLGVTAAKGPGIALGLGGGVYFWNKSPGGEVGVYGSVSAGLITNVGAGVGDAVTYLFGPAPSVLAGDSITVSIDVGVDFLTFSGLMILSAPPVSAGWPPTISGAWKPEIIGVGFAMTAGFSVLPVDISVMPGRTWIRPLSP